MKQINLFLYKNFKTLFVVTLLFFSHNALAVTCNKFQDSKCYKYVIGCAQQRGYVVNSCSAARSEGVDATSVSEVFMMNLSDRHGVDRGLFEVSMLAINRRCDSECSFYLSRPPGPPSFRERLTPNRNRSNQ